MKSEDLKDRVKALNSFKALEKLVEELEQEALGIDDPEAQALELWYTLRAMALTVPGSEDPVEAERLVDESMPPQDEFLKEMSRKYRLANAETMRSRKIKIRR